MVKDPETGEWSSINSRTNTEYAPRNSDGKSFERTARQVCAIRDAEPEAVIALTKVDAGNAFRQIKADTNGPLFGFVIFGLVIVDLFLQFGWTSSPAWWEAFGRTLMWVQNAHKPGKEPNIHPEAEPLEANRELTLTTTKPEAVPYYGVTGLYGPDGLLRGSFYGFPFNAYHVDDGLKVQAIRWEHTTDELAVLKQLSIASRSAHFFLLGPPSNGRPSVCPEKKLLNWDVEQEMLGIVMNTQSMTMGVSAQKVSTLHEELTKNWGDNRTKCSAREAWSLIGKWHSLGYAE
jgi:hypothetical protein